MPNNSFKINEVKSNKIEEETDNSKIILRDLYLIGNHFQ